MVSERRMIRGGQGQKHEVREIVIDAIANAAGGENVAGGAMLHTALRSRVKMQVCRLDVFAVSNSSMLQRYTQGNRGSIIK